eukprot:gene20685-18609_t
MSAGGGGGGWVGMQIRMLRHNYGMRLGQVTTIAGESMAKEHLLLGNGFTIPKTVLVKDHNEYWEM